MQAVIGISAFYHDSAAAIVVDGEIIAAAQEERFSRRKHDAAFPRQALAYVIEESGIKPESVAAVAFYEKPLLKFERLLETYHASAPRGLCSFLAAMPVWINNKLFMKRQIRREIEDAGLPSSVVLFPEHHLSHAASAFYPSPFEEAAILTIDGVGEWTTTTIGKGSKSDITIIKELTFPHSLGLLYSAVTGFCGFRVNSGEYKLMGLAPYGDPASPEKEHFKRIILDKLIDLRDDGSFLIDMRQFTFATGLRMVDNTAWEQLFGIPARVPEGELTRSHMNLALATQEVTEEVVLRLAVTAKKLTGCDSLVMAGGVALNCVANGRLAKKRIFRNIWIQPAAGDAGGAIGAALCGWHLWLGNKREAPFRSDRMHGSFLGPGCYDRDVERMMARHGAKAAHYPEFDSLCATTAALLADGNIIGWFQGRMEYGPRALGNRSILADPRNADLWKTINTSVKYREEFRPFAPSVLSEEADTYFDLDGDSPYMLLVAHINQPFRKPLSTETIAMNIVERLMQVRSALPVITHVDYSARIQTVSRDTNQRFYDLIGAFRKLTGIGMVVNTSFNVRGEPLVCRPEEAYRCFMGTRMDYLVIGNHLFSKSDQPATQNWRAALADD